MRSHIGIVGCSPPGAALCYQIICTEGASLAEHGNASPEVTSHTHPFTEYIRRIKAGDWKSVADLMLSSAEKLTQLGADFCVAPCNTIHLAFDSVRPHSPIPWLHIAEEVAAEAWRLGYRRVALLGTRLLLESDIYSNEFTKLGIDCVAPDKKERDHIDQLIFQEMVRGVFTFAARSYVLRVMQRLQRDGCDAVGMCCTELPLLISEKESALPILDSTRILALAALNKACKHRVER
jgi:aspartate racemase